MVRAPEQPTWALLVDHTGTILRVREAYVQDKIERGWYLVARESELLPWPVAVNVPVQRGPNRTGEPGDD